jgi:CHAD domain-containing protein
MRAGDPEGLHQMRVGLRRLRVAISLFSDMLRDPQTEEIVSKLKWISGELGSARELDVFIDSVAMPAMHEKRSRSGLAALFQDLKQSREDAFGHAHTAIESGQFRVLVVDAAGWIEAGDWTRSTDDVMRTLRNQPVAGLAEDEMRRCWSKILKRGRKVAQLGRKRRHKLRIQAKKLRYASEFFAGVFPGKKATKRRKTFVAHLEKLQDALGDLNDIAVHHVLTERIVDEQNVSGKPRDDCTRMAFAAGRLAGREEARTASVVKGAVYAHRAFAKTKPFWRQR